MAWVSVSAQGLVLGSELVSVLDLVLVLDLAAGSKSLVQMMVHS